MAKAKYKQKITLDKLNKISQNLCKLEEKPKSEFNLRESVYRLAKQLNNALRLGYSYEDLVKLLKEQDISISPATLKQYLSTAPKKSKRKNKQTKSISSTNLSTKKSTQSSSTNHKARHVSDNTNELPENNNQSMATTAILSGTNQDLSSEFNQY